MSQAAKNPTEAPQPPPSHGPAWQAALDQGFDMSLIEENLAKTPWERMRDHDGALRLIEMLQEAKRIIDAGP